MKKSQNGPVNRRNFLKGAAAGAAAFVAKPAVAAAQEQRAAAVAAKPAEVNAPESGKHASDFMVDVFKSLGMEYMFAMCASSFIGIHESIINYAGNKNPECITCTHEEISVAMANGYAKVEGKPVLVCVHGTVGTQHDIDYAAMAKSMGVAASGPISDPKELGPAIRRGIEVVKRGEPYLIDAVTQAR